jgi:hypothetical protein
MVVYDCDIRRAILRPAKDDSELIVDHDRMKALAVAVQRLEVVASRHTARSESRFAASTIKSLRQAARVIVPKYRLRCVRKSSSVRLQAKETIMLRSF